MINSRVSNFFLFSFLIFILSGCQAFSASDGLKIINDNLGKVLNRPARLLIFSAKALPPPPRQ